MQNIDAFNRYTAQILSLLYQHFPIPLSLNHESLADATLGSNKAWEPDTTAIVVTQNPDAKQRTKDFEQQALIAWHTIRWLHDCDYIRTNDQVDHKMRGACAYVLSPKGLEVLSIVPESLESKKSYGEKLAEAASETTGEAGRAAISEIVGSVVGAAWRASGLGGI